VGEHPNPDRGTGDRPNGRAARPPGPGGAGLLADVVTRLAGRLADAVDRDTLVRESLVDLAAAADAGRIYVAELRGDPPVMHCTDLWIARPEPPGGEAGPDFPAEGLPWLADHLRRDGEVFLGDVGSLPEAATAERWMLERRGARTAAFFGIERQHRLAGFVGFEDVPESLGRSPDALAALRAGCRLIAAALVCQELREGLARQTVRHATQLLESDRQYRALVEGLTVGVFRSTAESGGRCLQANPALLATLGYDSLEEFLAVPVSEHYVNPDDREHMLEAMRRDGRVDDWEVHQRRKDGSMFWASLTMRAERDESGRIVWMEGILFDVTERKLAEGRIRDASAFQAVIAAVRRVPEARAEAGVWQELLSALVERYGLILGWYGSYQDGRITPVTWAGDPAGYLDGLVLEIAEPTSPDARCAMSLAVLGEGPFGYADLAGDEGFRRWRDAALERGFASNLALPVRVEDRMEGGILLYADRPRAFPDRRVRQFQLIVAEMAALLGERRRRRRYEEALRESEERYRVVVESAGEAIITMSADGTCLFANNVAARRMGLTQDELVGRKLHDLFPEDIADRQLGNVRRVIRSGQYLLVEEWTNIRGEKRWYRTSIQPLLGRKGQPVAALVIARDATDMKRAEQDLRHANRKLMTAGEAERKYLAAELHDSIGQGLVAMKLSIQNAAPDGADSVSRDVARSLAAISRRCGELIREVRGICQGLFPPVLDSLGAVAAISQLVHHCTAAGVEAEMACDEPLRRLRFDGDVEIALFRIAQEAVSNAIRHGRARRIDVGLHQTDGGLVLSLRDNGVGFDPDDAPTDGMGLSTMRQRAAAVGGDLSVRSRPGETVVEANIPVRGADAGPIAPPGTTAK